MRRGMPDSFPVMVLSFFVAFCLSVLPLPEALQVARPEWVTLLLIYWVMTAPYQVGIVTAWCLGVLLDVLQGQILGQNALLLVVVTFFVQQGYQRLRMYSVWQQAFMVLLLITAAQIIKFMLQALFNEQSTFGLLGLISPLISALLWPILYTMMCRLCQPVERW